MSKRLRPPTLGPDAALGEGQEPEGAGRDAGGAEEDWYKSARAVPSRFIAHSSWTYENPETFGVYSGPAVARSQHDASHSPAVRPYGDSRVAWSGQHDE